MYDEVELAASLEKNCCQTQGQLALTLGVTQRAIWYYLKLLEMMQNEGNCLSGINEGIFCVVTSWVMKNTSITITQRKGNHWNSVAIIQHPEPSRIFMVKALLHDTALPHVAARVKTYLETLN